MSAASGSSSEQPNDLTERLYGLRVSHVGRAETEQTSPTKCHVCGDAKARPVFQIENLAFRVVTCPTCGLGWLDPQPTPSQIAEFYQPAYYGDDGAKFSGIIEPLVRWVGSRHTSFLARHLPPKARVLDVGCGRGVALRSLAEHGLECHGFEIVPEAVKGIDPRISVRVATSLQEAAYPPEFFDKVILWHVLEHVPDPRLLLSEIRRILKPNGQLVVAVPNFSSWQARWAGPAWFHLDLPRHLFHFPLASLERLLSEVGFHCETRHHFSLRQNPFGWIQSALNKFHSLPRNGVYVLLHRRPPNAPKPYTARMRCLLRILYWLGIPVSLLLSLIETLFRQGATIHIVARCLEAELKSNQNLK